MDELKEFYGKRVDVFFEETLSQRVIHSGKNDIGTVTFHYSGLIGTLERDTKNFIFFRDVELKQIEREDIRIGEEPKNPYCSKYVIAKRLVGTLTPLSEEHA